MDEFIFTHEFPLDANQLITPIGFAPIDESQMLTVIALWDTGASRTAISSAISHQLKLKSVTTINALNTTGIHKSKVYHGIIVLTNIQNKNLQFEYAVSEFDYHPDNNFEILIGMDIIKKFNWSLEPTENQIVLSAKLLKFPSIETPNQDSHQDLP